MLRSHCNCQSHDPTGIDWNPWNRTSLSPSEPRTKSVTQTANGDNGEVRGERRATPRWRNEARDGRQETEREGSNLNLREAVTQVVILTSCECSSVFLLQLSVSHSGASSFARWNKAALHGEDLKRHLFTPRSQTELSCTGITRKQNESLSCKISIWNETFMKKSCYGYNGLDRSRWCLYSVPLSCNCGIKREQLVARCHGKTPFPICYSHAE